ncbi:hypothetical protein LRS74_27520 [Streptomyces sp. LX-29]|uniref:DUF7848 domain-containing protein n=1 Tax=Streptomyces sp. LX-29 TaxID=2900152 RepID=UPI00240D8FB6|nr:hypothetical protein [Streptomyces sp. LX-29]WFB10368.1 hypothetical protein LRS74_27520 [Streptomyces sp. LX-29]
MSEQTPPASGPGNNVKDEPSLAELGRRGDDLAAQIRAHLGARGPVRRSVYRFRDYTIQPDRRPEAEAYSFTMQCAECGEFSEPFSGGADGTAWAVTHLKSNTSHLAYREIITRPYRFEPGAWQ